ncbi:hypothetical protein XELAEV_18022513mg [Xenopus laevis]|uniref:Uncharacterized protein n=1 Tax=Xenopus laevis TaxID=8355 RepID=A0A974HNS7_XENLA|nr:hypothetical protein XELAEV_18022513mg [Xenopus laevis]
MAALNAVKWIEAYVHLSSCAPCMRCCCTAHSVGLGRWDRAFPFCADATTIGETLYRGGRYMCGGNTAGMGVLAMGLQQRFRF